MIVYLSGDDHFIRISLLQQYLEPLAHRIRRADRSKAELPLDQRFFLRRPDRFHAVHRRFELTSLPANQIQELLLL
ncbi:hypothetical protein D3C76_1804060 [compost metagenome]